MVASVARQAWRVRRQRSPSFVSLLRLVAAPLVLRLAIPMTLIVYYLPGRPGRLMAMAQTIWRTPSACLDWRELLTYGLLVDAYWFAGRTPGEKKMSIKAPSITAGQRMGYLPSSI